EEYMKKYVFFAVLIISMNAIASSTFTALCVEEESVGYRWINKKWEFTRFNPDKYLVEKLSSRDRYCQVLMQSVDTTDIYITEDESGASHYARKACYNIRILGKERWNFETKVCDEYWKKTNGDENLNMV